jgi:hypothetical protein
MQEADRLAACHLSGLNATLCVEMAQSSRSCSLITKGENLCFRSSLIFIGTLKSSFKFSVGTRFVYLKFKKSYKWVKGKGFPLQA